MRTNSSVFIFIACVLGSLRAKADDEATKPFSQPTPASTAKAKPTTSILPHIENVPEVVATDGTLRFSFSEEKVVLEGGLQPFVFAMNSGGMIVQAQLPKDPYPSKRMTYPRLAGSTISRDRGASWTPVPLTPGVNGVFLEGGFLQLRNGIILALDTYITPTEKSGELVGLLYRSEDEWRTVPEPKEVQFHIPGAVFPSSDDGGRSHQAQRLHRRMIELPNGDLLISAYGWMEGDNVPSTYESKMMRTRSFLLRSKDHGQTWNFVSNIAIGSTIGTEGFAEPVLVRISQGPNIGRLRCYMRTGRELYETYSDDEGETWSPTRPRVLGGIDVYRTELWVDMFRHMTGAKGKLLDEKNQDELCGSVVNPDVVEMGNGLIAIAFGVRIPQKASLPHMKLQSDPRHPWNGNYLAISRDHGDTWSHVIRLTSGVATTHNMGLEALQNENRLFVAYDLLYSGTKARRDTWGRFVTISEK